MTLHRMARSMSLQVELDLLNEPAGEAAVAKTGARSRAANRLAAEDRAFHDWYRFVLAFPPHLVRTYLNSFGVEPGQRLLDPFCGTGTTLVEGKKLGCDVVGFEANTMPHLATSVKTDWRLNPKSLLDAAEGSAERARAQIKASRVLRKLPAEAEILLLKNSICELPLHKALVLRDTIENQMPSPAKEYAMVGLAKILIESASNLHFGPEVGVRGRKEDADVVGAWLKQVHRMAMDLAHHADEWPVSTARIYHHDAREMQRELEPSSIDAVFTSPPYPNEKDYTRTTRLESVVLGFISNKHDLQKLKKLLLKSNTRGVYKTDDDERWIVGNERVEKICSDIEKRRIDLGKTSGFERLYPRVTRLYFGGMVRQLASLRAVLKPGAMLGYVVGDQASYLQVMIRTGEILADLASGLGYEVCRLDLFRERFATATRAQIREEVLVLRWPG